MADEYPVLQELETKLKLQWIDTNDYLATQRAIIEVTPDHAYLELPRGRKGDKGDPGNAISFQGIVARTSDLPTGLTAADAAKAWVNTATKALHVWNGDQWFTVNNFAGVEADVQRFSQWFAQIASDSARAQAAAERAEFAAEETIQQVEGDFATRNYVDQKEWDRGNIPLGTTSLDELEPGSWGVSYFNVRSALGLPTDTWGNILLQTWGVEDDSRVAIYTDVGTDSRAPKMWVKYKRGGVWSGWSEASKTYDSELENVDSRLQNIEDSLVNSNAIRRIITSANPDEHLSEGDLLLVTEPPERLYRRLDSMDGVTQRWNVDSWDIATDSLDGESVALHTGGRQARRLASVDAVSGLADVEAVVRVKASSFIPWDGSSPGLVLRGSGDAGSETGYSAAVGRDTLRMGKFVNGAFTSLDSITETIPVGEWFWLRFRALGSKLQVKIWPDGTSEPAEWRRTTYDSSIEEGGWIGPSATTNSSDLYYHSIGVAALTSGDEQAPTEAV